MNLENLSKEQNHKLIPPDTFLLGYRGSIAHGMYSDPNYDTHSIDDKDVMGVCFGPIESYVGLGHFEQKEAFVGEWDCVTYEVRKYISLLMKMNPNVLSLLWLKPEFYILIEEPGQILIDNRHLFVCREAYRSFTGYAYAQLKRMEKGVCQGYMGERRKRLVEKYGYDTKNASHCIRLLRMGIEFLNDGKLNVFRDDAIELLDIKHGLWSIEKIKDEAKKLRLKADEALDNSRLPLHIDSEIIKRLTMQIISKWIKRRMN